MTQPISILVVSDDFHTRHELVAMMRDGNYRPLRARSFREAAKGLEQKPDLIIVDQRVRGTDGIALIRWLREQSSARSRPIVYCTSAACSSQTFNLLRNLLSVSLIVHKPFAPALLLRQINNLLPQTIIEEVKMSESMQPQSAPHQCIETDQSNQLSQDEAAAFNLSAVEAEETRLALAALAQNYLVDMPEMLYDLRNQITAAALERDNAALLQGATTRAHNIKGTAGTFGYAELSRLAGRIETLLRQFKGELTNSAISHEPIANALILVAEVEMWLEDRQDDAESQKSKQTESESERQSDKQDFAPVQIVESAEVLPSPQSYNPLNTMLNTMCAKFNPILNPYSQPILYPDLHREIQWVTDIRKRVLIIDSSNSHTDALQRVLKRHGNWHIESIAGGITALAHIDQCAPDLLILNDQADARLDDDLSGFDICKMIRCHPKWAALQIIMLTGDTSVANRQAIYKCGANDFVVKPILDEELITALRALAPPAARAASAQTVAAKQAVTIQPITNN